MDEAHAAGTWWQPHVATTSIAMIDGMAAAQRAIAISEAEKLAWVGARHDRVHDEWAAQQRRLEESGGLPARFTTAFDELVAEIGAALGVGTTAASAALDLAVAFRERCPRLFDLLHDGEISLTVARTALNRASLITDSTRLATYDEQICERITSALARGHTVLTASEVKRMADGVLAKLDPEAIPVPNVTDRLGVWVDQRLDGLADLTAVLLPEQGGLIAKKVEAVAESVCRDDDRPLGRRRAEALIALVQGYESLGCRCGSADCRFTERRTRLTAAPSRPTADVMIVLNESTLLGMDDAPAVLDGSVVPAAQARDAIERCESRIRHAGKLIEEADGPKVIAHDVAGYRPSQSLAETIKLLYPTCVFPGCAVASGKCQLDHVRDRNHRTPDAGGQTSRTNLLPLCGRHHRIKTEQDWLLTIESDGAVAWESPTGHTYRTASVRGTHALPDLDLIEWRSPIRRLKPSIGHGESSPSRSEYRANDRERRRDQNILRGRHKRKSASSQPPPPPTPPPMEPPPF